jgi:hypothetical protein
MVDFAALYLPPAPKRREHDRRAADKQPLAGIAKV